MSASKSQKAKPGGAQTRRTAPRLALSSSASAVALLVGVMALLSCLAGVTFEGGLPVFAVGDVADGDVVAPHDFVVEDAASTLAKRAQAARAEPPVFDLDPEPWAELDRGVHAVFAAVTAATAETMEDVRWQVAEDLNAEIPKSTLSLWRREDFQDMVLARVLPWLREYLERGVTQDATAMDQFDRGIVVRDPRSGEERLVDDPASLPDVRQMRSDLASHLKSELKKPLVVRKAVWALVGPQVEPSLVPNPMETKRRMDGAVAAVEPMFFHVRRGEVVVRQGEAVTPVQHLKLATMAERTPESYTVHRAVGIFALCCLFALALRLSARAGLHRAFEPKDYVLLAMVLLLFGGLAKFLALAGGPLAAGGMHGLMPYSLPVAAAAGVLALFVPFAVSLFTLLLTAFICAQTLGGELSLFSFYVVSGLVEIFVIKKAETRGELLATVFPLVGVLALAWVGVSFLDYRGMPHALAGGAYVIAGGAMSLILVLALPPIVELTLGYTSRFKLMELMSLEQPLMRDLMVGAPGTYHHSIVVSNMVEAGARAIGANPLLAKVAALYHDVGKLSKPQYFIENQMGGVNRHDKLSPSMSALILTSHVKQGIEMAREHKLGVMIEDCIRQHHGTTLISYFFHKATEMAEERGEDPPREEAFRYPGPKPQTKEAGLLLLADTIEASSRALSEPTPSRIRGHIESTVRRIFLEGQLDESALTLKDLHQISRVFERILAGIFHQRVKYPEDKGQDGKAQDGKQDAKAQDGKDAKAREAKDAEVGKGGGQSKGDDAKDGAEAPGRAAVGDERGNVVRFKPGRGDR